MLFIFFSDSRFVKSLVTFSFLYLKSLGSAAELLRFLSNGTDGVFFRYNGDLSTGFKQKRRHSDDAFCYR